MTSAGPENRPVWLITGCSRGLGRALAQHVLAQDHRCIVTARDIGCVLPLCRTYATSQAIACSLDVTNGDQIAEVVRTAQAKFGKIDVLVNNAGFGYNAGVKEGDEQRIRDLFETNFFGLSALTCAVLPLMRANRQGHIFNISSISGRVGSPGSAYYAASKFAVEGLSQGLAKEVAPLGIRVTAIEPGPLRTDFQGHSMTVAERAIADYADTAGVRRAYLRASHGKQEGNPERAAHVIFQTFLSGSPPMQLVLGRRAFEMAEQNLRTQASELAQQRDTALSIDFQTD